MVKIGKLDISVEDDLVENPTARVPICLVLDTSGSMSGDPINELNKGVTLFFESIQNDEIAKYAVEISIVTFGGNAEMLLDFSNIENQKIPSLSADGGTPMGSAVSLALGLLDKRKSDYKGAGVDYYQPWMILLTNGQPTDDIENAAENTSKLVKTKKLTIFPIGIGTDADMSTLKRFSPNRDPLRLKGLNFQQFFEWLSKSVSRVSQSTPEKSSN